MTHRGGRRVGRRQVAGTSRCCSGHVRTVVRGASGRARWRRGAGISRCCSGRARMAARGTSGRARGRQRAGTGYTHTRQGKGTSSWYLGLRRTAHPKPEKTLLTRYCRRCKKRIGSSLCVATVFVIHNSFAPQGRERLFRVVLRFSPFLFFLSVHTQYLCWYGCCGGGPRGG